MTTFGKLSKNDVTVVFDKRAIVSKISHCVVLLKNPQNDIFLLCDVIRNYTFAPA